jgi:hypothetical protein
MQGSFLALVASHMLSSRTTPAASAISHHFH